MEEDDEISVKTVVGVGAVALGVGVALGMLLNRKGRKFDFKFRPSGWWFFVVPAIEIKLDDAVAEKTV